MLKKDFILRILEQFAKDLAVFLAGRSGKGDEDESFGMFYTRYLQKEASFFYESDIDAIRAFINEQPDDRRLAYMEMLAELLYQDAPIHLEPVTHADLYEKSLALLEWLDEESKTYSLDRQDRMALIKLELEK